MKTFPGSGTTTFGGGMAISSGETPQVPERRSGPFRLNLITAYMSIILFCFSVLFLPKTVLTVLALCIYVSLPKINEDRTVKAWVILSTAISTLCSY